MVAIPNGTDYRRSMRVGPADIRGVDSPRGAKVGTNNSFKPNPLLGLPGPDAVDNLKTIAVSRLMLDNFDHVKAYWVMLGKATAQTALHFGLGDLNGTITDGGELTESYTVENGEVKMSKQGLIAMIENAGFEAVERDTVYNRVETIAV